MSPRMKLAAVNWGNGEYIRLKHRCTFNLADRVDEDQYGGRNETDSLASTIDYCHYENVHGFIQGIATRK